MVELLLGIATLVLYLNWQRDWHNRKNIEHLSAEIARLQMTVDHLNEVLATKLSGMPEADETPARVSPWAKSSIMPKGTAALEAVAPAPAIPSTADEMAPQDAAAGVATPTAAVARILEAPGQIAANPGKRRDRRGSS